MAERSPCCSPEGNNDAERELFRYYKTIFPGNDVCEKCRRHTPSLELPVAAWIVGNEFWRHEKRVLFVGKNARGDPGEEMGGFLSQFVCSREDLWDRSWPYWRYTREITEQVFGNDSIENIAFTNIVKCNDSGGKDTTSEFTKECCICQLGVTREEIALIRPTHAVFYTSYYYDAYLDSLFDSLTVLKDTTVPMGAKQVPWMEADCRLNGHEIRLLRVGHPERKKRTDFVAAVSSWILQER